MKFNFKFRIAQPLAIILGMQFSYAEESGPQLKPLRFFGNFEFGQIEEAYSGVIKRVDREIINHATVWALQEARLNDNTRVFLGVGGAYFFVFPRNLGANPYVNSKRSGFGLTDAHGEFTFFRQGEKDYGLQINAGYFGFKYNENASNLGEYLFRTWVYPTVIYTGGLEFTNRAEAQLSGFSFSTKLGGLKNELLITAETDHAPILGLNLTEIISYNFGGVFTLGGGFMFSNFYHPDKKYLTPETELNSYYTLSDGKKMASQEYKDLQAQNLLPVGVTITDTGYYSFTGQKVMAQAALDLGKFLPESFGTFKLYSEMVLLGLKDYPTYYTKIGDRIATLYGATLPTFGLLNRLSIEMEYCTNPFKNSTEKSYAGGSSAVIPLVAGQFPNIERSKRDDWKWSLLLERKILPGFTIYGQVANDHIRMLDVFSVPDYEEFLPYGNNWYWLLKMAYSI